MKVKWKHFKVGDLGRKVTEGKVNVCLVETAEQLVAFGHDGLRSGLGHSALGPPFIGLCSHGLGMKRRRRGFRARVGRAISFHVGFPFVVEDPVTVTGRFIQASRTATAN